MQDADTGAAVDAAAGRSPAEAASMGLLGGIELMAAVQIGSVNMSISNVLQLGPGSVVPLNKALGEPVDLLVDGRSVARGEVVVIDDRFGIRVTEVLGAEAAS